MANIWYKVIWYSALQDKIEEYEVVKETEKMLLVKPNDNRYSTEPFREKKKGAYWQYFDNKKDMKAFLLERAEKRLKRAEHQFSSAQKKLENIKNMEV